MAELNLAYHDIGPGRPGDRYTIDAATFERHVEATVGTPTRFTFDDGMSSGAELAGPILERHGFRGAFFVITKAIGKPNYLAAEQIRALRAAGHMIGSHTHSHPGNPFLKDLPDERVREEWRQSKEILEEILGEPVTAASAPHGFYARRLALLAAAEGYRALYVSTPHLEPRHVDGLAVHGRFGITVATSTARVGALARRDRRAIAIERAAWAARRTLQRALGPRYVSLRGSLLARRHA